MSGSLPPNIDLGTSTGNTRFRGDNVYATVALKVQPNGEVIEVTDIDVDIKMEDFKLELECLFPRNGQCCEEKFLKSCNSILSKTVHRFFNGNAKNFLKQFQPEISKEWGKNLLDFYQKSLGRVKVSYLK